VSTNWKETIESGEVLLIDGAMGTELQRRDVPMSMEAWSGTAVRLHAETVREVHEDYIRAGAQVIITNTFGSNRLMLEGAGLADEVVSINQQAVQSAMQARDNVEAPGISVAGSISAMPPSFDWSAYPEAQVELDAYRELAGILVEGGVDIIALEMMMEDVHAPLAMQAALETGLPIWLGVSCKEHPNSGDVVSFSHEEVPFDVPLEALIPMKPDMVNIMHSEIRTIHRAIEMVKKRWDGPIGVYPESGHFVQPNWDFVDVIPADDLAIEAQSWLQSGVQLLGGCCGTGPEHIRALRSLLEPK
jgi:S-methylmethionine-dependent homocysteine/selenocysteine methylase